MVGMGLFDGLRLKGVKSVFLIKMKQQSCEIILLISATLSIFSRSFAIDSVITDTVTSPDDPPSQYRYAYNVEDSVSGDRKGHVEEREGDVVRGEYTLIDADGFKRTVSYTADSIHGFQAMVKREPLTLPENNNKLALKTVPKAIAEPSPKVIVEPSAKAKVVVKPLRTKVTPLMTPDIPPTNLQQIIAHPGSSSFSQVFGNGQRQTLLNPEFPRNSLNYAYFGPAYNLVNI